MRLQFLEAFKKLISGSSCFLGIRNVQNVSPFSLKITQLYFADGNANYFMGFKDFLVWQFYFRETEVNDGQKLHTVAAQIFF